MSKGEDDDGNPIACPTCRQWPCGCTMTTAPKLEPTDIVERLRDALDGLPERGWIETFIQIEDWREAVEALERSPAPTAGLREDSPRAMTTAKKIDGLWNWSGPRACFHDERGVPMIRLEDAAEVASALLTLSKERGGVASPHQTIARDE